MKMKKTAAALLAAVLAVSASLAGAVNNALSVTASAEETEIKTEGDWEYKVNEDGETVRITKYNGTDTEIEFPATLDGKTVTIIGTEGRRSSSVVADTVTSVKIPDSVTTIGDCAFKLCYSLTSVTIPDSVTTIGEDAFYYCTSLTSIIIPNSVTTISPGAFSSCCSLTNVTIPDGVTKIFGSTFSDCTSLTSVTIPDSVTLITLRAFSGCTSLTRVTIPDSVTGLSSMAFDHCTSLESITVGENNANYLSIDGVVFNSEKSELVCYPIGKKDKSYSIPNSVTTIGTFCFYDCTFLTSVTIPDSVTKINYGAFHLCKSLETVNYGGTKAEWEVIEIVRSHDGYGIFAYGDLDLDRAELICSNDFIDEPPTSEPAESTVTPGGTDPVSEPENSSDSSTNEPTVLEATLKNVDSENGLSGEQLDKLLFGDSGWTWGQVEKIVFTSDALFSVQYTAVDGSTKTLGEKLTQRAEDDGVWNTEWTLDTSLMSKDKSFVKLIAKDGAADIKATIYIRKNAEKPSTGSDQADTGIALAIAPIVLAAGIVTVASKKKK